MSDVAAATDARPPAMNGAQFYEKFRTFGPFPDQPRAHIRFKPGAPERIAGGEIVYALYFPARRLVKIGVTSQPRARFRTLCQNMCDEAFWFAAVHGDHKLEKHAHLQFWNWRVRGEYFRAERELISGIKNFVALRNGRFRPIDLRAPRYT